MPLPERDVVQRTREFAAMFEGAGSVGPRQLRGQALRARNERWLRGVVEGVRRGGISAPQDSPAHVISHHRELDGELLPTPVAAVELLNVLRPTVAVARYVTFAALALHEHPGARRLVAEGGPQTSEAFVQEVRRFYPFFPLVGGRVMQPFAWREHRFAEGDWVMLDIYGTNRDPAVWDRPERFSPERFVDWRGDPYTLIPQGGGDHLRDHRCAGEWLTIALTRLAVDVLAREIDYDVPDQDLTVSLSRMPARPASGFVIERVRPRGEPGAGTTARGVAARSSAACGS